METFTIFSAGPFGAAVAERVNRAVPVRVLPLVTSAGNFDDLVRGSVFVGAALWRRYPGEIERLDAACARERTPWSSVVLEGTSIRCGPLVTPGRSPCHACYRQRWLSHVQFPERELALDRALSGNPLLGIHGFTPSSVRIAAAALLLDRESLEHGGGRVRRIDLLHCSVEEFRVVRVHGCLNCSDQQSPGDRYVAKLVAALRRGGS
jgi:bacteriocin biosynthesis cyclodehydratase domain-containing protein